MLMCVSICILAIFYIGTLYRVNFLVLHMEAAILNF